MEPPHIINTKPPATAAKTVARPYVRPIPRAMACARSAASLVPVEVAPAPLKPVAEAPVEVVDGMELIVDVLTRMGF